jgi:hypothetical protein
MDLECADAIVATTFWNTEGGLGPTIINKAKAAVVTATETDRFLVNEKLKRVCGALEHKTDNLKTTSDGYRALRNRVLSVYKQDAA